MKSGGYHKSLAGGPAWAASSTVDTLQPSPSASAPAAEEQPRVKLLRFSPGLPLRAVRDQRHKEHAGVKSSSGNRSAGAEQFFCLQQWPVQTALAEVIKKLPMDNYKKCSLRGEHFPN